MTITKALTTLSGPLIFGNEQQIAAHKFLEQVEDAKDAARSCRYDHEERMAAHTRATTFEKQVEECVCLGDYDDDVRAAAASMLVAEWRR